MTRRQYGYASVDDYYAAASSDQRLPLIATPLLLLNAYDDPIVPGGSLCDAIERARANPHLVLALTSHGGHLGWCEESDPWGAPAWTERVACGACAEFEPTPLPPSPQQPCSAGRHKGCPASERVTRSKPRAHRLPGDGLRHCTGREL